MKSFILFSAFLLLCSLANAQQDFEGMIRYKSSPEKEMYIRDITDNKDSMEINIWFTKGKILIRNISKDPAEDILVLIDSGKVYTIDRDEKTYRVKNFIYENLPPRLNRYRSRDIAVLRFRTMPGAMFLADPLIRPCGLPIVFFLLSLKNMKTMKNC